MTVPFIFNDYKLIESLKIYKNLNENAINTFQH